MRPRVRRPNVTFAQASPPSQLTPLGGADREMPHEPSRLLVAGDLHAAQSWFENLVYHAREQRCQAILQLGDRGYWPRIKRYDDFLRSLPRQLEGAGLDLYFVEGNHEDLDALFDTDFPQVGPFRKIEERVYHLPRGAQWSWHGLRFVSVGGGYSLDKNLRIPGYDWFERETLSKRELHAISRRSSGGSGEERPHERRLAHGAEAVAVAGFDRVRPRGSGIRCPARGPLTFSARCRFRRTKAAERTSSSPTSSRRS